MAGEFSWKWIFTSSLLFATWGSHLVTQKTHSSLVTSDDAELYLGAPPSPAESSDSQEEWEDDASLSLRPPEYREEDTGQSDGNRLRERLNGEYSEKAEDIVEGVSASLVEAAPTERVREETTGSHQILQHVIQLLSAHLLSSESQQQQQQRVDLPTLLPILSQAATQMGSPATIPGSADVAEVAAVDHPVTRKGAAPMPPKMPSQLTQEHVTTSSTKKTKPDPPPRTKPMSGGDEEVLSIKPTSPPTVQKQPPPLPLAKPKRTIDTSGHHQSARPPHLKQHHTPDSSQPEAVSQPETTPETVSVRKQALRLNQAHVVNGMIALPKNYAMLGGSHATRINVRKQPPVQESDTEDELGERDDEGAHHPHEKSSDIKPTEFTRSPYNLEVTSFNRGSLERKKSKSLKGAQPSTTSANDGKGQRKGERTGGFEIHHADGRVERKAEDIFEPDCSRNSNKQKSEVKSPKQGGSRGEMMSATSEEAESTAALQEALLSNARLLARTGDPERTIQLLQNMLQTLKSTLPRNYSPTTAMGGDELFFSELESEAEAPGLSRVGVGGKGDFGGQKPKTSTMKDKDQGADESAILSVFQGVKSGLTDTLRRQKNKKRTDKRPSREDGEEGVLTYLRRKMSSKGSSKPTVLRRGAEDDESDEAQNYEASAGSFETTVKSEDSALFAESPLADTSENPYACTAEAACADQYQSPRRCNDGEAHVYFALPDYSPEQEQRNILTSTSSSAVDDEHVDDSTEHVRSSSHTTLSGSSIDSGEQSENQWRENCTLDGSADRNNEQSVPSKRTKGRFLQKLFHRRKKQVSQPLPTAHLPLEDTDILLDEED